MRILNLGVFSFGWLVLFSYYCYTHSRAHRHTYTQIYQLGPGSLYFDQLWFSLVRGERVYGYVFRIPLRIS